MAESKPLAPALCGASSTQRSRRPSKAGEDVLVELAFDRQIAPQRRAIGQIGPHRIDLRHDRGQAGRRCFGFRNLDRSARIGTPHNVRAAFRKTDVMWDPAARQFRAEGCQDHRSRRLSEVSHAADTAWLHAEFQTGPAAFGTSGWAIMWRVELHDESRPVRRLRRKVYRELPVASSNRVAELDQRAPYRDIAAAVHQGQFGVNPAGAALALCRACIEKGLDAWCYEFGFPQIFTYTVTVVEIDGVLQVQDAFFNLGYPLSFHDMLQSLRNGNAVTGKRVTRDRKIYIMDPATEPERTVRWLEAKADRELEPVKGVRRFELAWSPEAFTATCSAIDAASRALAGRGYPGDLQYLMLHPVAVFDGYDDYRDPSTMPLVGGIDLRSPIAGLRVASRDLETERSRGAEMTAKIERLEAELARVAQIAGGQEEAERNFAAEREVWLQQKVALQAGRSALEGELAKTRSQLSAAIDLRAQRDSQIAQLRAEIEDSIRQFELERARGVALETQRQEGDSTRLRLEIENRDLQLRLEAASQQNEGLRQGLLAAEQHAIEITHCITPLFDQIDQLLRTNRSLAGERDAARQEKAKLDVQIAASPAARLRALWRRRGKKWVMPFRANWVRR